mmetsp:Transcript_76489/g.247604  ORF Transcript_76489/g.247604 Transcript_76489/m.247604 type:complete len:152 (+) Transcript_76489:144-599(+)
MAHVGGCPCAALCLIPTFPLALLLLLRSPWGAAAQPEEDLDSSYEGYGYECDMAVEGCAWGCSPPVEVSLPNPQSCAAWQCIMYCAKREAGENCLRPWSDLCAQIAATPMGAGTSCEVDCSRAWGVQLQGTAAWLLVVVAMAHMAVVMAAC